MILNKLFASIKAFILDHNINGSLYMGRESSFDMSRGRGMKILRGSPKIFRHPKGEL